MNFLAHAYLSFENPDFLVGNMISDFVKGRKKYDYAPGIQHGITLHRRIDEFTDDHLANRELKLIFKPAYRLYASPIMDVIYDHFLASDPDIFPDTDSLNSFSQKVYEQLEPYQQIFPERFARMFPYMRKQNWLYHYHSMEGVRNSMGGLQRRARYITEMDTAYLLLVENYETLRAGFHEFFPELLEMSKQSYEDLSKGIA